MFVLVKHLVYKHIVGSLEQLLSFVLYIMLYSRSWDPSSHCHQIPNPQSILVLIKEPFFWQHAQRSLQLRIDSSYPVVLELS